jgi:fission 1 protein
MAQKPVATRDGDNRSASNSLLCDSIKLEELRVYERAYRDEMNRGGASNQTRFAYGQALVRYKYDWDMRKGIILLEDLLSATENTESWKDYLFYLTIGNIKVKDFDQALECIQKFLALSPNDMKGKQLEKIIQERMKEEELIKYAKAGGAAAVVGAVIGLAIALGRKI